MRLKKLTGLLVLGGVLLLNVLGGARVSAAGSAVFSVEVSPNPVTAGQQVQLRFYVTPSGAAIYGGSVNVTLSNLTYISYNSSGSPFTGYNAVPSGGSAGSTSFSIAVSHSGSSSGSTGKALMGTVTAQAAGSPGTGQITLSGAQANDPTVVDLSPTAAMATTVQNGSVTINNPTAETCPAGKIGTPPNCTNPPADAGTGNKPGPSGTSTNQVNNPNPNSTVTVGGPTSESDPVVMSEEEFSAASSDTGTETIGKAVDPSKGSSLKKIALYGSLALVVVTVSGMTILRVIRRRRLVDFNHQLTSTNSQVYTTPQANPTAHSEPAGTVTPDDKTPPTPGNGPTIITPQQ